jgi:hypothetical protein
VSLTSRDGGTAVEEGAPAPSRLRADDEAAFVLLSARLLTTVFVLLGVVATFAPEKPTAALSLGLNVFRT